MGKQAALMVLALALGSCQAAVTPLQTAATARHSVLSVQEALSDADTYFITQDRSATYNPTQPPGTNANCGPTSLAMAVKAFHKAPSGLDTPTRAHALIQYVRKAMTGEVDEQSWTYPAQVKDGAQQLGLRAGLVFSSRGVVEAMAQAGTLVVVNVNPTPAYVDQLSMPYDGGHFALVTAIQGQQVLLNDPLADHPITISLAQLDEALTTSLGSDPFGRLVPAYNGGVALSP